VTVQKNQESYQTKVDGVVASGTFAVCFPMFVAMAYDRTSVTTCTFFTIYCARQVLRCTNDLTIHDDKDDFAISIAA